MYQDIPNKCTITCFYLFICFIIDVIYMGADLTVTVVHYVLFTLPTIALILSIMDGLLSSRPLPVGGKQRQKDTIVVKRYQMITYCKQADGHNVIVYLVV